MQKAKLYVAMISMLWPWAWNDSDVQVTKEPLKFENVELKNQEAINKGPKVKSQKTETRSF